MKGLCNFYGMTELSPVATFVMPSSPEIKKTTTVGCCSPMTELKIIALDGSGRVLKQGERGEVCMRGYGVMRKYWNDPEKTDETLVNGWIHSGDIGVVDEDGYIQIVGRSKDLIIRGGENISPFEIESFYTGKKWVRDI